MVRVKGRAVHSQHALYIIACNSCKTFVGTWICTLFFKTSSTKLKFSSAVNLKQWYTLNLLHSCDNAIHRADSIFRADPDETPQASVYEVIEYSYFSGSSNYEHFIRAIRKLTSKYSTRLQLNVSLSVAEFLKKLRFARTSITKKGSIRIDCT